MLGWKWRRSYEQLFDSLERLGRFRDTTHGFDVWEVLSAVKDVSIYFELVQPDTAKYFEGLFRRAGKSLDPWRPGTQSGLCDRMATLSSICAMRRSIFAPPGRGKSNASGQIDCAEPAEPLNTRRFEKQSKTIKMTSGGARPGAGRKIPRRSRPRRNPSSALPWTSASRRS
jgi:hypothetical protein